MTTHEIEIGNAARVTSTHQYTGSDLGAVRKAHRLWKYRMGHETVLFVFRMVDGQRCRPLETLKV